MQELSMNVLDIAQNSVAAGAPLTRITLEIDHAAGWQTLTVADNGKGMSPELAARVTDPFCTSRKSRKVGLGLPFLKMAAEMTGGEMTLESEEGKGTAVTAPFALTTSTCRPWGTWPPAWRALCSAARTLISCSLSPARRALLRRHPRDAGHPGRGEPGRARSGPVAAGVSGREHP